jgi:co-chaperonin GroES (HSP10)
MKLRLLGPRVLVRTDAAPTKTQSGIHLSGTFTHPPAIGTVIAVGTGWKVKNKPNQLIPLNVGERVHFKPYTGQEFEFEGEKLKLLDPNDVMAILEPNVIAETHEA